MNTNPIAPETPTPTFNPALDALPPTDLLPEIFSEANVGQCPGHEGRANGKVGRLPEHLRDQINHWLLDSVTYPDITRIPLWVLNHPLRWAGLLGWRGITSSSE